MFSLISYSILLTLALGAPQLGPPQEVFLAPDLPADEQPILPLQVQELPLDITFPPQHENVVELGSTPAPAAPPAESPAVPIESPVEETDEKPVKPPVIELIEEALVASKTRPLQKQTAIINAGKLLSEGLTAKIVGPIVIFNSKVASAAGALPPLLAAKGAIIGSAIATPIEIGAVAGSSIVSGVTGKLVAVPITVAAGAAAKFVDAVERGEEVVKFNLEHGCEILKNGLIKIGHIILKPIAIVVGAQTAITGAGIGIAGTGIKGVGIGIEAVGAKMMATGLTAKALGTRLIKAQFPPYLK